MNEIDKDFILAYYGEFYNEECGPWNTSLISKWYDYITTDYFEEHFDIDNVSNICNIGVGPGVWDRYLSYKMPRSAKLVCVDIDTEITETLRLCLINEGNKRNIEIVNKDIFTYDPNKLFDIITVIGSAITEIGFYNELFLKVFTMLNNNGCLFYSSVDKNETKERLEEALKNTNYKISDYIRIEKYNKVVILSKISRK